MGCNSHESVHIGTCPTIGSKGNPGRDLLEILDYVFPFDFIQFIALSPKESAFPHGKIDLGFEQLENVSKPDGINDRKDRFSTAIHKAMRLSNSSWLNCSMAGFLVSIAAIEVEFLRFLFAASSLASHFTMIWSKAGFFVRLCLALT